MHGARLTREEPPSEREIQAEARVRGADCDPRLGLLFPGIAHLCRGQNVEGAVLAGLGAAELGTGIGVGIKSGFDAAGAGLPLLAYGDTLTISVMDSALETQRAGHLRFVPQESLAEMAVSPFSGEVLRRPEVWGGILGTFAAGMIFSQLAEGGFSTDNFGKRPVLFGRELNSAVGYPLGGAIGLALFDHVAVAEESAFRGILQSGFARRYGETQGWLYGSIGFGLIHASNIFFMAPEDRLRYLALGVPFITLLGSYLGWIYRRDQYSLGPSIAVHFWYDFLIEAAGFVLDPKNSPLALRLAVPF